VDAFSSGGIFVLKVVGTVLIFGVLYFVIAQFLIGSRAFKEEREQDPGRERPLGMTPGPSRTTLGLASFVTFLIVWVWLDWF
jgi:hypothetical protein